MQAVWQQKTKWVAVICTDYWKFAGLLFIHRPPDLAGEGDYIPIATLSPPE